MRPSMHLASYLSLFIRSHPASHTAFHLQLHHALPLDLHVGINPELLPSLHRSLYPDLHRELLARSRPALLLAFLPSKHRWLLRRIHIKMLPAMLAPRRPLYADFSSRHRHQPADNRRVRPTIPPSPFPQFFCAFGRVYCSSDADLSERSPVFPAVWLKQ
jgi:hypothetical protein